MIRLMISGSDQRDVWMNHDIRVDYAQWCRDTLFSQDIVKAAVLLQQVLNIHLLARFSRLGLADHLLTPTGPQQSV